MGCHPDRFEKVHAYLSSALRVGPALIKRFSGFSMKHLMASARKAQKDTGQPVFISHISSGRRGQREVVLKPDATLETSTPR